MENKWQQKNIYLRESVWTKDVTMLHIKLITVLITKVNLTFVL